MICLMAIGIPICSNIVGVLSKYPPGGGAVTGPYEKAGAVVLLQYLGSVQATRATKTDVLVTS